MADEKLNTEELDFLCKLIVGIGEVSQITNIPCRQIRYWEDKGIIKSLTEEEGKNRRYDYVNIKKMLLVKLYLEEGYTLDAAALKVEQRILYFDETFRKLKESGEGNQ